MSFLQNTAIIPPSTTILHQSQDDTSKVTEQLRPDEQGFDRWDTKKFSPDWLHHEQQGAISRQRSQRQNESTLSRVGLIRPLARLIRQPVKTLGELYADSDWVFDGGKKSEQVRRRKTEVLYSELKQVSPTSPLNSSRRITFAFGGQKLALLSSICSDTHR